MLFNVADAFSISQLIIFIRFFLKLRKATVGFTSLTVLSLIMLSLSYIRKYYLLLTDLVMCSLAEIKN